CFGRSSACSWTPARRRWRSCGGRRSGATRRSCTRWRPPSRALAPKLAPPLPPPPRRPCRGPGGPAARPPPPRPAPPPAPPPRGRRRALLGPGARGRAVPVRSAAAAGGGGPAMTVPIAGAEPVTRRLLQAPLEAWGPTVTAAADGGAAWRLFEAGRFPLVLTD